MSEAIEVPKSLSLEPRPISPEVVEKFSKGDVQLGNNMAIQGEGKERKLRITVTPDDPSYIQYQTGRQLSIDLTQQIHRLGDKGGAMDKALDIMNLDKRLLEAVVTQSKVMEYVNNNLGDLLRRFKEIPQDKSTKSIKLRQQLESEVIELGDLFDYTQHLVGQKAVEIILPEQKAA